MADLLHTLDTWQGRTFMTGRAVELGSRLRAYALRLDLQLFQPDGRPVLVIEKEQNLRPGKFLASGFALRAGFFPAPVFSFCYTVHGTLVSGDLVDSIFPSQNGASLCYAPVMTPEDSIDILPSHKILAGESPTPRPLPGPCENFISRGEAA